MSANDELQAHTCEKMLRLYENQSKTSKNSMLEIKDTSKKISDLTEQWKKGELESGWYYVKGADGLIGMMSDYALYRVNLEHPDNEITLLAKMPSYEEYSRLEWYAGCGPDRIVELNKENRQLRKWCEEFKALDVAKENQQLKELLKECRVYVENCEQFNQYDLDMLGKIDEVLNG